MQKSLILLAFGSLLVLNACNFSSVLTTSNDQEIPELGVSVGLPSGYTIETVYEDAWEIHRVFNGEASVVDIETIENYNVYPSALISADAIKIMFQNTEGVDLSEMNSAESNYGATLLGETPDSYYVFGGVYKDETHEAVCQLNPSEDFITEEDAQLAFEICASLKPLEN